MGTGLSRMLKPFQPDKVSIISARYRGTTIPATRHNTVESKPENSTSTIINTAKIIHAESMSRLPAYLRGRFSSRDIGY